MFSLIIPVFRNEDNIAPLLDAVERLRSDITDVLEVIFVVDGSPDDSYQLLRDALPTANFSSQLIALSRNFGAFAAIRAGLERARGQTMAVMAADLQEPPELVVAMQRALSAGQCDVAYGERTSRRDPLVSRVMSRAFWGLYRRVISRDIPPGGVDVFGMTAQVRDQVLALSERNSSLIGLLFWVGFRRQGFPYERARREIGTSAWTFVKKWRYMQDSIFSFSDLPIAVLITTGFAGLVVSGTVGVTVLVAAMLGQVTVPGYAATMLAILFFGALQIFSLGILGVYLWRVFENTKGRPLHIVMSEQTFDDGAKWNAREL